MRAIKKQYSSNPQKSTLYDKSLSLAKKMYDLSENFPDYLIRELIRKSAAAISTNIAESRATKYYSKEFSHLNVAIGGISQIKSLIELALVRSFITFEHFNQVDSNASELLKMSFGLIKRLKENVGNAEVKRWWVEDFRQSHLYNRSIDLFQSIYMLVDMIDFNINEEQVSKAYRIAVNIPILIALGIGQLNLKEEIKKFNKAKDTLMELRVLLDQFQNLTSDQEELLGNIENCRIQVVKLVNSYFGRLKSSSRIEQL